MIRPIALLAAAASLAQAQAAFEGSVAMKVTGDDGKANDVAYLVKGSKIRMEMSAGRGEQAVMIFDLTDRKMLILMSEQKMYMEQSVAAAADAASDKASTATIKRTGKTETIAGYKCEHVMVIDAEVTADVCVASGFGTFRMPSAGGRRGPPKAEAWEGALGESGFPLKVQKGDKVTMEVTKIDKKSLDAALFAPPEGFTKMDMGSMMRRRRP